MKLLASRHWTRSLRFRLLAATLAALVVALVLAGPLLAGLFRDHVMRQFSQALTAQLDQITARLEFDGAGQPQIDAQTLSDPRWSRPYSGLYWQADGAGLAHRPPAGDNACKWARHGVQICAASARSGADSRSRIVIDDDGPGIDAGRRAAVMARGARLDEAAPGSGLGLAIVNELVGPYGDSVRLQAAPTGGLRVELELPGG